MKKIYLSLIIPLIIIQTSLTHSSSIAPYTSVCTQSTKTFLSKLSMRNLKAQSIAFIKILNNPQVKIKTLKIKGPKAGKSIVDTFWITQLKKEEISPMLSLPWILSLIKIPAALSGTPSTTPTIPTTRPETISRTRAVSSDAPSIDLIGS